MSPHAVELAPSILAADFARLGEQVAEAERYGTDRVHVDVRDGHFVLNISFGAVVVEALRPVTRLPLEVHLMIPDPDAFFDELIAAGGDSFLMHWEGNNNLADVAGQFPEVVRELRVRADELRASSGEPVTRSKTGER